MHTHELKRQALALAAPQMARVSVRALPGAGLQNVQHGSWLLTPCLRCSVAVEPMIRPRSSLDVLPLSAPRPAAHLQSLSSQTGSHTPGALPWLLSCWQPAARRQAV
jgi:hypothetical protein